MRQGMAMMTLTLPQTHSSASRADWANAWLQWSLELPEEPRRLSVAELAECHCPDLCDRDHGND
ncbi:MAG: hypothetical protein M3O78_00015 [Chloroflexota bacterium]|nr:hypothetical protein [Chloroflexota bacterium]